MNNSEAAFMLSSVLEFIHVWRIGNESSLTLECKDGKASINFHCKLGRPDQAHIQDGRQSHKKKKKKSASRVLKNNARAARHQALSRSSPPVSPEQHFIFAPPAPPGTVTSPIPHITSSSHQPCPALTPPVDQDELRETIKTQAADYCEPPHAEESREDKDISCLPSSPLLQEEEGTRGKSVSESDSSLESESDDIGEDLGEDHLDVNKSTMGDKPITKEELEAMFWGFKNEMKNHTKLCLQQCGMSQDELEKI